MQRTSPRLDALVLVLILLTPAATPALAESDYDRAAAAFAAGDWAGAAAGFEAVLETSPAWAPGHLVLGQCYWLLGRGDEGAAAMAEAERLDPGTDLGAAYVAVGQQLYRTERYDEAVRPLELAVEHADGPTAAVASRQLAEAYLLAERYEDARAAFERHRREFGADRRTTWRLALACRKLDAFPCALENARAALDMDGDDPSDGRMPRYLATWSRAWALAQADEARRDELLADAVDDARRWVAAEPRSADARRLHAETLIDAGRAREALATYGPDADAGDCTATLICARAHLTLGDAGTAESLARRAVECESGDAAAWTELGAALVGGMAAEYTDGESVRRDRARGDEALAAFDRALALAGEGDYAAIRAAELSAAVRARTARLDAAAAEFALVDRINQDAADNAQAAETLARCRSLRWDRRDGGRGLSPADERWYAEHDCAALLRDERPPGDASP